MGELETLQQRMGWTFRSIELLERALTHRSFANELQGDVRDNQRLEFLGDAILGAVITETLFSRFPDFQEGALSRIKSHLVCEATLARLAVGIALGRFIRLGRGEDSSGGRQKASVLADCYEALVAAIHLDGGFEAARAFVMKGHEVILEEVESPRSRMDAKSRLQERLQRDHGARPHYRITGVDGPDHDRRYTAEAVFGEDTLGTGVGRSKKEAQQEAARVALETLDGGDVS